MSIKLKHIYLLFLGVSAASLAAAYLAEYVMEYRPCALCVYQRFPYLALIMLAIIGLSSHGWKKGLLYLFLVTSCSAILAGYHAGVERGIFELSSFCKPLVSVSENLSASDFKNMLYNSDDMPMCNRPSLFFAGLSMAEWNLILSMTLLGTIIIASLKSK